MNLKAIIICEIVSDVAAEMGLTTDDFFDAIDHDMEAVIIGIKLPSTGKIVLYFLKDGDNCRFFLPHELA